VPSYSRVIFQVFNSSVYAGALIASPGGEKAG